MISARRSDNKAEYSRTEPSSSPDSPLSSPSSSSTSSYSSPPERAPQSRDTRSSSGSINLVPERSGSFRPLVSCGRSMTSGELEASAPLLAHRSARSRMYKVLCFMLLALQGGVLDFYLISFTDLYWCSWIATDLVLVSGWAVFFNKNARSKRERACGFHQKSSAFGCSLGEFTHAHLAWLIYVIACSPKVVLVLETNILELLARRVACGITGFRVVLLLSAPLLFCLINAVIEDPNGATRHHAHSRFLSTCLDLLDVFTLLEPLIRAELALHLRYAVLTVYLLALALPVLWLYELTARELRCRVLCARFCTCVLVNGPLLAVRCLQVFLQQLPVSVFLLKNAFFLICGTLELIEMCMALRSARKIARGGNTAQFSRGVSDNDMCPHGYVNTLAVTQS